MSLFWVWQVTAVTVLRSHPLNRPSPPLHSQHRHKRSSLQSRPSLPCGRSKAPQPGEAGPLAPRCCFFSVACAWSRSLNRSADPTPLCSQQCPASSPCSRSVRPCARLPPCHGEPWARERAAGACAAPPAPRLPTSGQPHPGCPPACLPAAAPAMTMPRPGSCCATACTTCAACAPLVRGGRRGGRRCGCAATAGFECWVLTPPPVPPPAGRGLKGGESAYSAAVGGTSASASASAGGGRASTQQSATGPGAQVQGISQVGAGC